MSTVVQERHETSARRSLRWWILGLLFAASVLNYVDRQALSLLAPTIQAELGLSDTDYSRVVQLFLLAYTISYLLSGRVADWLGSRISLALFVGWWSLANMATGFVTSMVQLGIARFSLGLGEAGNYTAAPKVVGEWLRPSERALGVGIYTAGAMVGATISPILIGWLGVTYGWRFAFLVTGLLGFVWIVAWLAIYRPTASPPFAAERAASTRTPTPWREILTSRWVLSLILVRLLTDPVWYFYLFWFPKYLSDARGFTLEQLAITSWIVYLAADAGSILGGVASARLGRRGLSPLASRMRVMSIAAIITPVSALVAADVAVWLVFVLASLVVFSHLSWQVNVSALVIDVCPPRYIGTVFGLVAAGSGLGGMLSTWLIGELVVTKGYGPVFVLMALVHPLAWLIVRLVARNTPPAITQT